MEKLYQSQITMSCRGLCLRIALVKTYQTLSSSAHAEGVWVAAPRPVMHHLVHKHHLSCFLWLTAQLTLTGLWKHTPTHTLVHPGIFRIWQRHQLPANTICPLVALQQTLNLRKREPTLLRSLLTYHLGARMVARCVWCYCGICCSSGRTAEHGSPRRGQRTPLCCTSGSQKQSQGNLDHRRQAWAMTKTKSYP